MLQAASDPLGGARKQTRVREGSGGGDEGPEPASLPPMEISKKTLCVILGPFAFFLASAGWHVATRRANTSTAAVVVFMFDDRVTAP